MKLKIKTPQPRYRNRYEIHVTFMMGDGDQYVPEKFYFSDNQYNHDLEFKDRVHEFIKHIQSCIKIDSKGRGGFRSAEDLNQWYNLGIDYKEKFEPAYKWPVYCENSADCDKFDNVDDLYNVNERDFYFSYTIPSFDDGWYASYYSIDIIHYNNDGDISPVEIIEDDN